VDVNKYIIRCRLDYTARAATAEASVTTQQDAAAAVVVLCRMPCRMRLCTQLVVVAAHQGGGGAPREEEEKGGLDGETAAEGKDSRRHGRRRGRRPTLLLFTLNGPCCWAGRKCGGVAAAGLGWSVGCQGTAGMERPLAAVVSVDFRGSRGWFEKASIKHPPVCIFKVNDGLTEDVFLEN
jgi:hypothetical protein